MLGNQHHLLQGILYYCSNSKLGFLKFWVEESEMGRAPCCDKANVKRGPWSPEEDAKLKAFIEEHGTGNNWIALPHKIGLKRCGKSCRLRWLNYLRPNIRHGGFSEEEDNIICNLYISIGSRWSIIAAQLPGRTDNDIKNYWNTRLKKKLLGRRKDSSKRAMSSMEETKEGKDGSLSTSQQTLNSSAIDRLQLHMQLQGLNMDNINPFSFYNNPAIWPKLVHPLPDQMTIPDHQMQQFTPLAPIVPYPSSNFSIPAIQGHQLVSSSLNGFSSGSIPVASDIDTTNIGAFRQGSELSEVINGKSDQYLEADQVIGPQQQQINGEESSDKNDMNWWIDNGFCERSSSSSWESNPVDLQNNGSIFHDYILEYGI